MKNPFTLFILAGVCIGVAFAVVFAPLTAYSLISIVATSFCK